MNKFPQFILISILSCICFGGVSQDELLIVGEITDIETGLPVRNVHITIEDFSIGTITSEDGIFNLVLNELPAVIKLSHVSYEDKFIRISEIPFTEISIQLQPKTVTIDEVVITDEKIETVFRDDNYSVLDYEFHDDNLLILVYRFNFSISDINK